jgi:hypothetical protein
MKGVYLARIVQAELIRRNGYNMVSARTFGDVVLPVEGDLAVEVFLLVQTPRVHLAAFKPDERSQLAEELQVPHGAVLVAEDIVPGLVSFRDIHDPCVR